MGYYVFNPFTKKMDWTEAGGGGGPSFASIWTSQLSFGSATGGSMFASTVSFSSITVSECNLNKNTWNYRNLTIAPNISFASAKIDINADAMLLTNASGYTVYSSTVDLTVTISVSGISGLMGSAEASSQWYHIWGISDGVNFTAILDSSDSSPTLPAGYSFKCYLGAVYNNSSGNFLSFKQTNNVATIARTLVLNSGSQVSYTAVDLTTVCPSTAKKWVSNMQAYHGDGPIACFYYSPVSDGSVGEEYAYINSNGSTVVSFIASVKFTLYVPQTIYYKVEDPSSNYGIAHMYALGWEF